MMPKPVSVLLTAVLVLVVQASGFSPRSSPSKTAGLTPGAVNNYPNCTDQKIQILDSPPSVQPDTCVARQGQVFEWDRGGNSFTVKFDKKHHPFLHNKYKYSETTSRSDTVKPHTLETDYKYTVTFPGLKKPIDPHVIILP
jgi:hypothetical protein